MLADYQTRFIEFAIANRVLQFGKFELKSGRVSPYFFNVGLFNTGSTLRQLGGFYAEALVSSGLEYDLLLGPAYKGIPLVTATSIALVDKFDINSAYAFNRKEVKTHGEGGRIVGADLASRVVIVDDVITAGTAIREVMGLLADTSARAVGVLVAIDRQERGSGQLSAIQEIESDYRISVVSVVNLSHIIEYLESSPNFDQELDLIRTYYATYGTGSP